MKVERRRTNEGRDHKKGRNEREELSLMLALVSFVYSLAGH